MLGLVRFVLPDQPAVFGHRLLGTLTDFGTLEIDRCRLHRANDRHLPEVCVVLGHVDVPTVELTGDQVMRVELRNTTGIDRSSPYAYEHISLDDYLARAAELRFAALDPSASIFPGSRAPAPR